MIRKAKFLVIEKNKKENVYCYNLYGRKSARNIRKQLKKELHEIHHKEFDSECATHNLNPFFCIIPLTGTRL